MSFWILIAWRFVKGVAKFKKLEDNHKEPEIIQLVDGSLIIMKKSVTDSPWVLGYFVAADGAWTREYVTIKSKLVSARSTKLCVFDHLHSTREKIRALLGSEYLLRWCRQQFGDIFQQISFVYDNRVAICVAVQSKTQQREKMNWIRMQK